MQTTKLRPASLAVALAALLLPAIAHAQAKGPLEALAPGEGRDYVVLINGGDKPAINFQSHLHHLQDMYAGLGQRGVPESRVTVFCSDGGAEGADMATRELQDEKAYRDFWLLEGTRSARYLKPNKNLVDTKWDGVDMLPATYEQLRRWFKRKSRSLVAGDTLFVYVTDHGTKNKVDLDNCNISLWRESMSVAELRALYRYVPAGVRVVSVMSQCHSGSFAQTMYRAGEALPSGNSCGFYSTLPERLAYGCYPEGRGKDKLGHGFRFIDAMSRNRTLAGAQREVMVTDRTPDVPIATSDVYLNRLISEEAARQGVEVDALVDAQLAEVWKDRASREREIRVLDKIAQNLGLPSPRTLGELRQRLTQLQSIAEQMDTYADRWQAALNDLREENLHRFVQDRGKKWQERLKIKELKKTSDAEREKIVRDLLPALRRYTIANEAVWERLTRLRKTASQSSSARYRLQVRLAGMLRLRTMLTSMAGRQLLSTPAPPGAQAKQRSEAWQALARLEACEASEIGDAAKLPEAGAPIALPEVPQLPSYAEDAALVKEVVPSWLGIRFQAANLRVQRKYKVERGAVQVRSVVPDSPAQLAGLRPGDLVLGPPGAYFDEPRRIREWTMTSPQSTPLPLEVMRSGETIKVAVSLEPYPVEMPSMPEPPKVGDAAPAVKLERLLAKQGSEALKLEGKPHLLYFWATWCGPCKKAVPELLAWQAESKVSVISISDEEEDTLREFLGKRKAEKNPFPDTHMVSDVLRQSFVAYGVSGTPTFVLIDAEGKVSFRQVGYTASKGLKLDGWSWSSGGGGD